VPPLAVVGLTLEAGATDEAWGASLLFLTNVGAILLSGLIVMALFRVSATARVIAAAQTSVHQRVAIAAAVGFVVVLTIPLGAATVQLTNDRLDTGATTSVAQDWAEPAGWRIVDVEVDHRGTVVRAAGPLPAPSAEELRAALDAEGLEGLDVTLELIPEEIVELPGR
jgi:hypothetical protein